MTKPLSGRSQRPLAPEVLYCLRCGREVSQVGTCHDCRSVDRAMCTRITQEARRYRNEQGVPRLTPTPRKEVMTDDSTTPYAGSSGWTGSDASRQRAEHEERSGKVAHRQAAAHRALSRAQERGHTCRELEKKLDLGHGSASATLTRLHLAGYIARLTEKRGGQSVYVVRAYLEDREESPYRRNRHSAELARVRDGIGSAIVMLEADNEAAAAAILRSLR